MIVRLLPEVLSEEIRRQIQDLNPAARTMAIQEIERFARAAVQVYGDHSEAAGNN